MPWGQGQWGGVSATLMRGDMFAPREGNSWVGIGSELSKPAVFAFNVNPETPMFGTGAPNMQFVLTGENSWFGINGAVQASEFRDANNEPGLTTVSPLKFSAGLYKGVSMNAGKLLGATSANTLGEMSIVGTTNRITVSTSGSNITLSTPQDLHTGATPTFGGLTVNGALAVNSGTLGGYGIINSPALIGALAPYATTAAMNTALGAYHKISDFNASIANYPTTGTVTAWLSQKQPSGDYVTQNGNASLANLTVGSITFEA
jgi:hypothetical protein